MLHTILPINEGIVDRVVRVGIGLGLLALTVAGPQTLLGLIGVVPLVTGVVGSCPLYRLLGVSTASTTAAAPP